MLKDNKIRNRLVVNMRKKIGMLVMAVSLFAGTLSGCTIGNTEFVLDVNNVGRNDVFSINGATCTKEEAKLYLCNYQNLYGYEYGIDLWQHDFGDIPEEETLAYYVKEVTLMELANVFCMNQLAEEQELVLTDEEKEFVSKAAEEYYASLSKEELKYIGMNKGDLEDYYERYALAQKFYSSLTQGVNEEVSDDEARVVRVQQVFLKSEADAKIIVEKLNEGIDFQTLAATYNETEQVERHIARGMYPDEVEKIVFSMENGEVSGMIAAEDGYYFIRCVDKFVKDLTEANKKNIIAQRRDQHFEDVFGGFVLSSDFDLNEKVWDSMEFDTSGTIKTDSFFAVYDKYFAK